MINGFWGSGVKMLKITCLDPTWNKMNKKKMICLRNVLSFQCLLIVANLDGSTCSPVKLHHHSSDGYAGWILYRQPGRIQQSFSHLTQIAQCNFGLSSEQVNKITWIIELSAKHQGGFFCICEGKLKVKTMDKDALQTNFRRNQEAETDTT